MISNNSSLQIAPELLNEEMYLGRSSVGCIPFSQVSANSESEMDLEAFKQEPLRPQLRKMISNSNICNKYEDGGMKTLEYQKYGESPIQSDGDLFKSMKNTFFQTSVILSYDQNVMVDQELIVNTPIILNQQPADNMSEREQKFNEDKLEQQQKQIIEEQEFVQLENKPNVTTRYQAKKKTPNKNNRKISSEEELFNSQISQAISLSSASSCHCSKTHCLKLYCQCFHNNRFCGENCDCNGCYNDGKHETERTEAIDFIKSKGQRNSSNDIDIFDTSYVWGCKCKKTKCLKGYCECFIRGKKCTSHCKCEQCDNRRNNVQVGIKKKIKKSK